MVTELLGADLMEHNILHSGIGIDEALGILQRFYDIDNIDIRGDPHQKYIAQMEADVEELEEGELDAEEKLEKIGFLLGVENVTQKDIDNFLKNIKKVKPRKVESFGFGKIVSAFKEDWFTQDLTYLDTVSSYYNWYHKMTPLFVSVDLILPGYCWV